MSKPETKYCAYCRAIGKSIEEYTSHFVRKTKNENSKLTCPELLKRICKNCPSQNHTWERCPVTKDSGNIYNEKTQRDQKPIETKKPNKNRFSELDEDEDDEEEKEENQVMISIGDIKPDKQELRFEKPSLLGKIGFTEVVKTTYDWTFVKYTIENYLQANNIEYFFPETRTVYYLYSVRGIYKLDCEIYIYYDSNNRLVISASRVRNMRVIRVLQDIQRILTPENQSIEEEDFCDIETGRIQYEIPESEVRNYPPFDFNSLVYEKALDLSEKEIFDSLTYEEQQEFVGEEIYGIAYSLYPAVAGKLVGMILELEPNELASLIGNNNKTLYYIHEVNDIYHQQIQFDV